MNKLLRFKSSPTKEVKRDAPWKVLIVDDERDVHIVTELALKNFEFENRNLLLLHAYSAADAKYILAREKDIALVILDVVMESDQSGLQLVKVIRKEFNNHAIRIVLRTGQPGQAPEQQVIKDYDINGYKNKAELTATRLYTLIYANLRSYRDIITLESTQKSLEKLVLFSQRLSQQSTFKALIATANQQLVELLCHDNDRQIIPTCYVKTEHGYQQVATPSDEKQTFNVAADETCQQAIEEQKNIIRDRSLAIYCSNNAQTLLFHVATPHSISHLNKNLFQIFTDCVKLALENYNLLRLIENSQHEMIYRLGEVVETRSNETGHHVKRVAHYSQLLAELAGMPTKSALLLKHASPLHDIGKIGIPDLILNKPGKLSELEWQKMKSHTTIGHEILSGTDIDIMNLGATISLTHHERWDGQGYPRGLAGEEIPLVGRVTALADVFDALASKRCYKEPWPLSDIMCYIESKSGTFFDPTLVALLVQHLDRFIEIRERFSQHEYSETQEQ